MQIKFISVLSGNDKKYSLIKDNFQIHLENVGLANEHELIETNTDSGNWQEEGFLETVYKKLDFTRDYLKQGYQVFCSDLDIVFLKNPIPYLKKMSRGYNIIFQNDYAEYDNGNEVSLFCTGFYFVNPSPLTVKLFDREVNIFKQLNKINLKGTYDESDQNYINIKLKQKRFNKLQIKMLDKDIFPNGWWWLKNHSNLNPDIIHYNCISGIENKIREMKKYNHWLI